MQALSISHLSKSFRVKGRTVQALDDVSLSVEQGEIFGLLGPNGAGKSTLISALSGIVRPDAGEISILGHDVRKDFRQAHMAIGIVPQEVHFDFFFTVREMLLCQSGYFGLRDNRAWVDTLIERLGLSEKADARVNQLSGGMKRRVLIAQALVHRPPVIVLDEPTAGVDVELRRDLWNFMKEFHANGHTIILTTHYIEEAEQLCARIALLNHGRVIALDETSRLLTRFADENLTFTLDSGSLPEIPGKRFDRVGENRWHTTYRGSDELISLLSAIRATASVSAVSAGPVSLEEVFINLVGSNAGEAR